jgi:UDP-N-acetylmuramoylalanine--D-glutamate ligase
MTTKERVKGRKIGVIGMARSGLAAAELILRMDGQPFVSDNGPIDKLSSAVKQLKTSGIEYETGGHTDRLFKSEFVILSPGVPVSSEIVQKIKSRGIPVFSEIELASWFCRGRIIAVTGSNGKTTTTTLIGVILTRAGIENRVCGNIGFPFSAAVESVPADGWAVVELSSFQLESIEDFTPEIALILNITPDHLDRYDSYDSYKQAKYRIAEGQSAKDFLIINEDSTNINSKDIITDATKIYFSITRELPAGVFKRGESLVGLVDGKENYIIDVKRIKIPGLHNLQNAAAASLACLLADVPPAVIGETLDHFPGVEHRLEDVVTYAGIRFVNDSKATNVDSVTYALRSFETPICLIAGGRDKDSDFRPLLQYGKNRIKEVVLIGEAREKMFDTLGKTFPVQFAESMKDAVRKAFAVASPGDIVLLSPACASFDMFDNFEHRGKIFKKEVLALNGIGSPAGSIGNNNNG